jgi:Protein of unknown function (DUF2924)
VNLNIAKEVAALRRLSNHELRAKHAEIFGDDSRTTNNRVWLIKRIAWRLQALAEGDLSERARERPPNWPMTPTFACRRHGPPGLHRLPRRAHSARLRLPFPRITACPGPARS